MYFTHPLQVSMDNLEAVKIDHTRHDLRKLNDLGKRDRQTEENETAAYQLEPVRRGI